METLRFPCLFGAGCAVQTRQARSMPWGSLQPRMHGVIVVVVVPQNSDMPALEALVHSDLQLSLSVI